MIGVTRFERSGPHEVSVDDLLGKVVCGYRVERALGSGPTGRTFAARRPRDGRAAAVKLLHPALSALADVERYQRAAARLDDLDHRHIAVPSAVSWTDTGQALLESPLFDGVDLDAALRRHGRLPAGQTLRCVGQVCLALEAGHGIDEVHGSLKPSNIILVPGQDQRLSVRVTDFGIHRLLPAPLPEAVRASPYLAPEAIETKPNIFHDIYALGRILAACLTGDELRAPSEPSADDSDPSELPWLEELPHGLRAIVARCLEKDPKKRYQQVRQLREALEAWAADGPAELDRAPVVLFETAKNRSGQSVGLRGVPSKQEPSTVATESSKSQKQATKKANGRSGGDEAAERELASLAEQAAAPLREARQEGAEKSRQRPAAQPDGGDQAAKTKEDTVTLPIERTVKKFVSNISPSIPAEQSHGANGASLEAALDDFVSEAKAWTSALPSPDEDQDLSELAKVPAAEPQPAPPAPAPAAPATAPRSAAPQPDAPAAHASARPVAARGAPEPRKAGSGMMVLAVLVGAVVAFGLFSLIGGDDKDDATAPAASAPEPASSTGEPATIESAGSASETAGTATAAEPSTGGTEPAPAEPAATGEPAQAGGQGPATATSGTPAATGSAADEGKGEPASGTPSATAAKTPSGDEATGSAAADKPTPAGDKAAGDKTAGDNTAGEPGSTDQATETAAKAKTGEPAATAGASTAKADEGDKGASTDKSPAKPAARSRKHKASGKAAARRRAAARKARARRRAAARRKKAAAKKKKAKKAKKAKGSDWVDPFSR